jgi:DNA-binding transcriptional regulator GbsR (MarR family)
MTSAAPPLATTMIGKPPRRPAEGPSPETVQLAFADAWGEMGPAWNVTPSVARVHGYLLAQDRLLTEREVREALDMSHRAASIALSELEAWGLVERVAEARERGRRGPSATAWRPVGDRWRWFQLVTEQRRAREAEPIKPRLEACLALARDAHLTAPDDPEAARLLGWLTDLQEFVGLFDRAVRLLGRARPADLAHAFAVFSRLSDEALDRLLGLLGELPEGELADTLEAFSRVSPRSARRILSAARSLARLRG